MIKKIKVYVERQEYMNELGKILNIDVNEYLIEYDMINNKVKYDNKKRNLYKNEKILYKDDLFEKLNLFEYYYGKYEKYYFNFNLIYDDNEHYEFLHKYLNVNENSKFVVFPEYIRRYYDVVIGNYYNKHPIFIISKGRWKYPLTSLYLLRCGCDNFKMVIEESEYKEYSKYYDDENLLILDESYKEKYDTLDNLNDKFPKGSGPVRNFVWDYAYKNNYEYYWLMDDNISYFLFYNENKKYYVMDMSFFGFVEKIIESYDNIGFCGLEYDHFVIAKEKNLPYKINSRIFSTFLFKTDIDLRWKCRYNEDVILNLELFKKGYSNVLINFLLAKKIQTQQIKGGNTSTIYNLGTLPKTVVLWKNYPECTKIVYEYNRIHHKVDYNYYINEKNNLGNFIGYPLKDNEKEIIIINKNNLNNNFNIIDVYSFLNKKLPFYVNKEKLLYKINKINKAKEEDKIKNIERNKDQNKKKYYYSFKVKNEEKIILICGDEIKQSIKNYNKIKKIIDDVKNEFNFDTIYSLMNTSIDCLISVYAYDNWLNFNEINELLYMKKEEEKLKILNKIQKVLIIVNKKVNDYLYDIIKYFDKNKIIIKNLNEDFNEIWS